ncbi:amidohydrolase family protein [Rhodococcus opacus]|uniref:amidohydrolase family protein n=1 Tax=Rhodococcus opacus TaxID=37919 RepID=UPI0005C20358|nr:amidohydrolase family protein [Rhodococcus opacus]MDX5965169.1 amidohydrolase family protein [Rhodococcus opacus]NKY74534.1 amidohydrolase family protein [Rhodococcus opacus]CAG7620152.1 Adenine deaminase [Rhodococcus opacus]
MTRTEFVIRDVRVFDGEKVVERSTVHVRSGLIEAVTAEFDSTDEIEVVDGRGKTLLPGLIDSHTHAQPPSLKDALLFGVTTELDMFSCPEWMDGQRRDAAERNDLADVRSASIGATVLGGHPSMMIGTYFAEQYPVVKSLDDASAFVAARVAEGADYIKLLIDDGTALGHDVPTLGEDVARAIANAAHDHGKMAVAHVTSLAGAEQALRAGVDGLVHMFFDRPPTDEIIAKALDAGVFITPTLSTVGSLASDIDGTHLANDDRARPLIPASWRENLCQCWQLGSPGSIGHAIEATRRMHEAGVDILAGTDAAGIGVVGTAHGVSMHGELELLVRAGLSPVQALRAATSMPARRFGLSDRGRIAPGLQADLLLVEGDPTEEITATLSIAGIWRRGDKLSRVPRDSDRSSKIGQPAV